jgi:hypothetical protein
VLVEVLVLAELEVVLVLILYLVHQLLLRHQAAVLGVGLIPTERVAMVVLAVVVDWVAAQQEQVVQVIPQIYPRQGVTAHLLFHTKEITAAQGMTVVRMHLMQVVVGVALVQLVRLLHLVLVETVAQDNCQP